MNAPGEGASDTARCEAVRLELGAYVLDGLGPQEAAAVDAHLATCPGCRAEAVDLAELPPLLALADGATPAVPADLRDRAVAAAARKPGARPRRRRAMAAVAAAAALVGGLAGAAAMTVADRDPPLDEVVAVTDDDVDVRIGLRDTDSGMDVELDGRGFALLDGGYYHVWLEWPSGRQASAGTFVPDARGRIEAVFHVGGWRADYTALEVRRHDRDHPDGEPTVRVRLD